MRSARLAPLALLAIVMGLLFAGCGDSSSPTAESRADTTTAGPVASAGGVSADQVGQAEAGSPEAVVLRWWRDVQLNEPADARGLYLEEPSMPDLAGQFNYVTGKLSGTVAVAGVQRRGDAAEVRVRWTSPDGEVRVETLGLEREAGEWKLVDVGFLDLMVQRLREAEEG